MITHICDRCGRPIEQGQSRYIAKIQVFAAADPLEITLEDLLRDTGREMEALLQQCGELSEEELMSPGSAVWSVDRSIVGPPPRYGRTQK